MHVTEPRRNSTRNGREDALIDDGEVEEVAEVRSNASSTNGAPFHRMYPERFRTASSLMPYFGVRVNSDDGKNGFEHARALFTAGNSEREQRWEEQDSVSQVRCNARCEQHKKLLWSDARDEDGCHNAFAASLRRATGRSRSSQENRSKYA